MRIAGIKNSITPQFGLQIWIGWALYEELMPPKPLNNDDFIQNCWAQSFHSVKRYRYYHFCSNRDAHLFSRLPVWHQTYDSFGFFITGFAQSTHYFDVCYTPIFFNNKSNINCANYRFSSNLPVVVPFDEGSQRVLTCREFRHSFNRVYYFNITLLVKFNWVDWDPQTVRLSNRLNRNS